MKVNNKYTYMHFFLIFLALILFFLDRLTKILLFGKKGCLLFLCLTNSTNTGGFFGTFQQMLGLIIVVSIAVLLFLVYFYIREDNVYVRFALIFLITGVLSNLVDRIFYGHVIDWLTFSFGFTSFNFADCYVWIGIIIFLVSFLKYKRYHS